MSKLHKLFKEIEKLDYDDFDLLCDAWRESFNVRQSCERIGVKYKDKFLVNALTKHHNLKSSAPMTAVPSSNNGRNKKIEQIILGDNLDIIEEAAKKKGLI